MFFPDLNFYAALVIVAIDILIGMLWYSKEVFGKTWAKELGKDIKDLGRTPLTYSQNVITSILSTVALGYIFAFAGADTVFGAIKIALLISFVIASIVFKQYLFNKTSWKILVIDFGYPIVYILVAALIFGYWN